jgi:hypothetical protein
MEESVSLFLNVTPLSWCWLVRGMEMWMAKTAWIKHPQLSLSCIAPQKDVEKI